MTTNNRCFTCGHSGIGSLSFRRRHFCYASRQLCQDCQLKLGKLETSFLSGAPGACIPLPVKVEDHMCARCGEDPVYGCWQVRPGTGLQLCTGCDIELMRQLLQSLGCKDWESDFIAYIGNFWEDEMVTFGAIPSWDPLAKEILRLEAEGKWPPERLRDHKRIADWLEVEASQAAG